jgi:hypothetical protein
VGGATPPKCKKRCKSSDPSGSARSFYNRCEVEKARVAGGSEPRAPTRGSDEEGRPVSSTINARPDHQSGGHSWAPSWGQSGLQTEQTEDQDLHPVIRESYITLIILMRLLSLKLIAYKPLEIAEFGTTVSQADLAAVKASCSCKLSNSAESGERSGKLVTAVAREHKPLRPRGSAEVNRSRNADARAPCRGGGGAPTGLLRKSR